MSRVFFLFALIVSPFALLNACGGAAVTTEAAATPASQPTAGSGCETCVKGKAGEPVWCDHCNKGFVGGKVDRCKACFKGKAGEPVWCDHCKHGFVDGKQVNCEKCYKVAAKVEGAEPCADH